MKIHYLLILALALVLSACGSSKSGGSDTGPTEEIISEENIDQKYKSSTLLNRISREPAVSVRAGVPLVTRSVQGKRGNPRTLQPLYIVDEVIIGRSYTRVAQMYSNPDIKTIEVIQGPDASFYGARGGYGVIKLTTYK